MPSPQSLVTFVTTLFILLLVTHVQYGIRPTTSAFVSSLGALLLAGVVELLLPPEPDEDDDAVESDQTDAAAAEGVDAADVPDAESDGTDSASISEQAEGDQSPPSGAQ